MGSKGSGRRLSPRSDPSGTAGKYLPNQVNPENSGLCVAFCESSPRSEPARVGPRSGRRLGSGGQCRSILVFFFILFLSFTKRLVQDFVDEGLDVVFRFLSGDLCLQIALHMPPDGQPLRRVQVILSR